MKKVWIFLTIIFIVALFLRLYHLGDTPSGFHQDEVVNAYVGRFILDHGVDLYGNHWPLLYFDKHGDFPPVIPMYISALGTYLFGLTQLGARFFIALIGALVVFPVFFIIRKVFRNDNFALLGALLISITPWHVSFSRIGAEGIIATTVFMYGLWLFLDSLSRKHAGMLTVSIVLFFLTYLLYPSFRITVPLVLLASLCIYRISPLQIFKKIKPAETILIAATVLSIALTVYISTTPWGRGRYDQTSIFSKFSGISNPANQFIYNENNILVARIFNNKVVYVTRDFIAEYMSYFSPDFLFTRGGQPGWFAVPNTGLFYLTFAMMLLPLFLPFLYKKNPNFDTRSFFFLLALLFVAPIASALTTEYTPNTHRSLLMSVMFIFLFVYGFSLIQNLRMKNVVNMLLIGMLAVEFIFFFHNYFQHVGMYTSVLRGDGNRQMVEYLQKERSKYDKVYMLASGWFPIYYLYFTGNFDPNLVGKIKYNMRTDQVDNVHFIENDCPEPTFSPLNNKDKVLIVMNSSCKNIFGNAVSQIGTIAGADRNPIYVILQSNN